MGGDYTTRDPRLEQQRGQGGCRENIIGGKRKCREGEGELGGRLLAGLEHRRPIVYRLSQFRGGGIFVIASGVDLIQ
jgi:hypothetical protein